jgi:hypothetical protein
MKTHASFKVPENLDLKVWRYIDFTKYVSMLSTSSLFFVRADMLDDKFEGTLPKKNIENRDLFYQNVSKQFGANGDGLEFRKKLNISLRRAAGISCWQLSEFESAALWKLYLKSNEGVAIQTTFSKLSEAVDLVVPDEIYTGLVRYTDYDTDEIDEEMVFDRFLIKRQSFDFEKEVRSMFLRLEARNTANAEERFENVVTPGETIRVDLGFLIESVVISPYADDWFFELVKSVTIKYGYTFPVIESKLKETPAY